MEEFLALLGHLIKRPGMFGINKVEELNLFLLGYQHGLARENSAEVSNMLSDFTTFMNKKDNSKKGHHWTRLIRLYSGSDRHSLELFITRFNEFLVKRKLSALEEPKW